MGVETWAMIAGVLLGLLSGLWLSHRGRPLQVAILTAHKLVSLAAAAAFVMVLIGQNQLAPLDSAAWSGGIATGLCFLAAVFSGGVLSTDRPVRIAILRIHQIAPLLVILFGGATLFFLLG